ncbi:MAG: sugar O-acetyltransferase, partial [Clostridia bacterium]|nr:sugar O-acetyltransferase [Clostridia bacterium]
MTEDEKRAQGLYFCPADPTLKAQKLAEHKLSRAYNNTDEDETEKREEILA